MNPGRDSSLCSIQDVATMSHITPAPTLLHTDCHRTRVLRGAWSRFAAPGCRTSTPSAARSRRRSPPRPWGPATLRGARGQTRGTWPGDGSEIGPLRLTQQHGSRSSSLMVQFIHTNIPLLAPIATGIIFPGVMCIAMAVHEWGQLTFPRKHMPWESFLSLLARSAADASIRTWGGGRWVQYARCCRVMWVCALGRSPTGRCGGAHGC